MILSLFDLYQHQWPNVQNTATALTIRRIFAAFEVKFEFVLKSKKNTKEQEKHKGFFQEACMQGNQLTLLALSVLYGDGLLKDCNFNFPWL